MSNSTVWPWFVFACVASIASVSQIRMVAVILDHDVHCRTEFSAANSTDVNEQRCWQSLLDVDIQPWHCTCRFSRLDNWIRVFDDASTALAAVTTVGLIFLETFRTVLVGALTFGCMVMTEFSETALDDMTLLSAPGLIGLLLNPFVREHARKQQLALLTYHGCVSTIVLNTLMLAATIQYCQVVQVGYTDDPWVVVALVVFSLQLFMALFQVYIVNNREYQKTAPAPTGSTVTIVTSTTPGQIASSPPPYMLQAYNENDASIDKATT